MCGIAGFNFEDKALLQRMCSRIEHRGPDQHGCFVDSGVSLGHQRLSIIDLSEKGSQPMTNEDGSVVIVFNGEVYNYQEIRKKLEKKHRFRSNTDTEVKIHAYEEYGTRCIELFIGMFAFCIYDAKKKIFFIARDRLGIKPVYYRFVDGSFSFASELKALLELPVERVVSKNALNTFLALRYLPGEETMVEGFKKLLPAHYLILDLVKKSMKMVRYWDIILSNSLIEKKSEKFFEAELKRLLLDSVRRRLISDVPLGVFLSGGLDSSMIVALMAELKKEHGSSEEIKTFSVGFNLDSNYEELGYAKKVSDYFGTDHEEVVVEPGSIKLLPKIVWHLDEPMADPAAIPNFILSRECKRKATVILTGAGADEVFAGYEHYKFLTIGNRFSGHPRFIREKVLPSIINNVPDFMMNRFFKYPVKLGKMGVKRYLKFISDSKDKPLAYMDIVSIIDEKERKELLKYPSGQYDRNLLESVRPFFSARKQFLNQVLEREIKHFLPEQVLFVVDRMNMAFSVEGRVPFVDHRIVEFSARLPTRLKLNGLKDKYIMKRVAKGMIPEEIIKRKKQGFYVPIDLWLNKDLKSVICDTLSKERVREQGFFRYDYIRKVLDNYESSKLYYARQLWSLLNFELWHKIYIENAKIGKMM